MMNSFEHVVQHLESLSIMPKEMPGIQKLKQALNETEWYSKIDEKKVIVVAGTNGKGSTCAILESLLDSAGKKVGFYSSPHLIDTTERIRVDQASITKTDFVKLFKTNEAIIQKYQLTHFEALTLMCADYFFSEVWNHNLDFAIFEVGLGGLFDATNAIPHATSVLTALSLDHTNILGTDLLSIAKNKFGIIQKNNLVVHHRLPTELNALISETQIATNSNWKSAASYTVDILSGPVYILKTIWGSAPLNLLGRRAAENAATALTVCSELGFDPSLHLNALSEVIWYGRMQKIKWPSIESDVYLSGDHNLQGIESLKTILDDFTFQNIFFVVGIGKDKDFEAILQQLLQIKNCKLFLTETPFKGVNISDYPKEILAKAVDADKNVFNLLEQISDVATKKDLVVITGSLYLVGHVFKELLAKIGSNKNAF